MSRKRRDIIPTSTSQLVAKLAYSGVVQENITKSSQKGKKVPSNPAPQTSLNNGSMGK